MTWMLIDAVTGAIRQRGIVVRPVPAVGEEVCRETQNPAAIWQPAKRAWSIETEASLIAAVKAEGERRRMLVLSPGGSKKTVYPLQQMEVEAWRGLGSTVTVRLVEFLKLSNADRLRKFRFASRSAARRGEADPAAAIARFAAGADRSNDELARIEAIEQAAVEAIRAASTMTAKLAVVAAINWDWS